MLHQGGLHREVCQTFDVKYGFKTLQHHFNFLSFIEEVYDLKAYGTWTLLGGIAFLLAISF